MSKNNSFVIWVAGVLVGVALFSFGLMLFGVWEEEKIEEAHGSYEWYMSYNLKHSPYPIKLATIVSSYNFYNEKLDGYKGEVKEDIQISLETIIARNILALPDGYSIPKELLDKELVGILDELIIEDFLTDYEQDVLRNIR